MKLPVVLGLLTWQSWAIVLLVIVIAGLSEASYRAHREEQKMREGAEAKLTEEGSITLSMAPGRALTQDPQGKLRQVILASVHNDTGKPIDTIVLQAIITSPDGHEYPYQLCEPFSLLVDQTQTKDIAEYSIDGDRSLVLPVFWTQVENRWVREPGGLVIAEEATIILQAISSSARAVRLGLVARFENNHWHFDVA
jgi:hypothetical protein